jgi:hypothetical protein
VTAKGEEAVVSVLQSKELQPAVDAAFISAGTDEAVLTTRYAQQLVQVTISPETVRVRIRIGENPTEEQQ